MCEPVCLPVCPQFAMASPELGFLRNVLLPLMRMRLVRDLKDQRHVALTESSRFAVVVRSRVLASAPLYLFEGDLSALEPIHRPDAVPDDYDATLYVAALPRLRDAIAEWSLDPQVVEKATLVVPRGGYPLQLEQGGQRLAIPPDDRSWPLAVGKPHAFFSYEGTPFLAYMLHLRLRGQEPARKRRPPQEPRWERYARAVTEGTPDIYPNVLFPLVVDAREELPSPQTLVAW